MSLRSFGEQKLVQSRKSFESTVSVKHETMTAHRGNQASLRMKGRLGKVVAYSLRPSQSAVLQRKCAYGEGGLDEAKSKTGLDGITEEASLIQTFTPAKQRQLDTPTPSEDEQIANPAATNDAEPLDDGPDAGIPAPAAPAQAQSPGPSCGNPITWTPKSPVPVSVNADSAAEFLTKMNAALGGNPHMQASMSWSISTDPKGKADKIDFTLETTMITARYAGGRPPANEKTIITEMVDFIKQHEERHRDASREVSQQAVCDALGKTAAQADKVLKDAMCKKEPTAQEAIDAKEGKLELVTGANGAVTGWKAVGITQNYHDPNCK